MAFSGRNYHAGPWYAIQITVYKCPFFFIITELISIWELLTVTAAVRTGIVTAWSGKSMLFALCRRALPTASAFKDTSLGSWTSLCKTSNGKKSDGAQNSSSALRLLDAFSCFRRSMQSVRLLSPWTLLSRVRTFTVSLLFSFSPTTGHEISQEKD